MIPSSTVHFSWPTGSHPVRSTPLNNCTHWLFGSFGRGAFELCWAAARQTSDAAAKGRKTEVRIVEVLTELATNCICDSRGPQFDLIAVRRFHHHASQRLCPGEADNDAAGAVQFLFARLNGIDHARQLVERLAPADPDIDEFLRENREIRRELIESTIFPNAGFERFERGEHAIAGGRVFAKDHVPGLLSPERGAATQHFFENVFVAHGGSVH